jgi:hypothetical protein
MSGRDATERAFGPPGRRLDLPPFAIEKLFQTLEVPAFKVIGNEAAEGGIV